MNHPFRFSISLACGALVFAGAGIAVLRAAPQAPAPPSAGQEVTYDFGAARWINLNHTLEASKGVTFVASDSTLKTDSAIAYLDAEQNLESAKSLAPVHLYDPQNDLTGNQGTVDFPKHLATIKQNVVLTVKPGPQTAEAPAGSPRRRFHDPATMTCQLLTYDYRRKFARVPGPLKVVQSTPKGQRVLTADSGIYDGMAQLITLKGNVRGRDSEGETIQTTIAYIGVKEGAETLTIPVQTHGKFRVKDQPDDASPAPADTTTIPPLPVTTPPTPTSPGTGGTP